MTNINVTNFRKDIYELLEQTIKFNEPVKISTKKGNAVLISESDYNSIMETLYLTSDQEMRDKIVKGINTPVEDCVKEE